MSLKKNISHVITNSMREALKHKRKNVIKMLMKFKISEMTVNIM